LFVSLSSDRNVGTLEIVSNEQGFQAVLNGRPARVARQRNRNFIYNVDAARPATIQITKAGFTSEPAEQQITVRKGEIAKATFRLAPVPTTATIHLAGVLPGTRVTLNGAAQTLRADGGMSLTVSEGEHTIELTRQGFRPKSVKLQVKAGQTVNLSGGDVQVSEVPSGTVVIAVRAPANARIILRRGSTETVVTGREQVVPEGDYQLLATAPGYRDDTQQLRIRDRETVSIEINLVARPQIVRMEGWEESRGWQLLNGWFTRKGGNFLLFKSSSNTGTYHFSARHRGRQLGLFSGGRIQWVAHYVDQNHYDLYQLDTERLSWRRVANGRPGAEKREPHRIKISNETYQLQLDVSPGQLVGRIFDGQNWRGLPRLEERGAPGGRFGLYLPGNDEVWIQNFEFRPKE
jgi:hypothetical protein